MNRLPWQVPDRHWEPRLKAWRWWLFSPLRRLYARVVEKIDHIEVQHEDRVRRCLTEGKAVLILPNHPGHADSSAILAAAERFGRPVYFMTAWQVFAMAGYWERRIYEWHGCFSVDREGIDRRALRTALEILMDGTYPLVIFPEGEVYHLNDRIAPFYDGPAAIALSAARKGREVVVVPCGIRYLYVQDPMPELLEILDRIETRIGWRPRRSLDVVQRVYRFAEAAVTLKELEYLGRCGSGELTTRIRHLADTILSGLEQRHGVSSPEQTIPGRVKTLRRIITRKLAASSVASDGSQQLREELDDLHVVVQLFSYPGNYLRERPTLERLAETIDKFEEDVLEAPTARPRGRRAAVVLFGEPIEIRGGDSRDRDAVAQWTKRFERAVQQLLDELSPLQTPLAAVGSQLEGGRSGTADALCRAQLAR